MHLSLTFRQHRRFQASRRKEDREDGSLLTSRLCTAFRFILRTLSHSSGRRRSCEGSVPIRCPAAELSPNPRHLPCLLLGVGGPRLEGLQPHPVVLVHGSLWGDLCAATLAHVGHGGCQQMCFVMILDHHHNSETLYSIIILCKKLPTS